MSKTPREIDLEQMVGQREIASLRNQVILLGILLVAAIALCVLLIYAMNSRFPQQKFIYTQNAAAVCTFAPLNERGDVTDAAVMNFAVQTAADMHTFDYINWRKTLDGVTLTRFTPEARADATRGLRDSNILPSVVNNSFVLKAVPSGPASIRSQGTDGNFYTWDVAVPMTLAYTGGMNSDRSMNYRPESRTIVLTIRRAEFTADNPDGLLVASMSSSQSLAGREASQDASAPPAAQQ